MVCCHGAEGCPDAGELCGLVHGFVPGLLFDDGVDGLFGGAGPRIGVEYLAVPEGSKLASAGEEAWSSVSGLAWGP